MITTTRAPQLSHSIAPLGTGPHDQGQVTGPAARQWGVVVFVFLKRNVLPQWHVAVSTFWSTL